MFLILVGTKSQVHFVCVCVQFHCASINTLILLTNFCVFVYVENRENKNVVEAHRQLNGE